MAPRKLPPQVGQLALHALITEGSPLGPLKVMADYVGCFFQIPISGFRPYVVFGPEANRKVLVTERDKVLWRNSDPVTDLLRRGVLVTDGDEHDRYRNLMEPSLHPSRLLNYTQMMLDQTDRVSSAWKNGDTVDMLVESRKIALSSSCRPSSVGMPGRIFHASGLPILKAIQYISPGPWILWRHVPRPGYQKYLKTLDKYLYEIIRDRKAGLTVDDGLSSTIHRPPDLLQHLIDAGLTDDVIRDQMLTMLIAGHDTSTALQAWTFALLGQHPDIHARLVEEVDTGQKSALLDQVIKESLRLYPPISHRQPARGSGYGIP